jgi:hypothetical protein
VLDFGVRAQGGHVRASLDRTLHTASMQHFPPAKHCASVRKRDRWSGRCAVIGVRHTSSATDERAAVAASTTAAINERPILQRLLQHTSGATQQPRCKKGVVSVSQSVYLVVSRSSVPIVQKGGMTGTTKSCCRHNGESHFRTSTR